MWNIFTSYNNSFLFEYILKCNLFLWCAAVFSASLLQSSVSHDLQKSFWYADLMLWVYSSQFGFYSEFIQNLQLCIFFSQNCKFTSWNSDIYSELAEYILEMWDIYSELARNKKSEFWEKSQNCEFILSFIYGSLFPPQNKKKVIAIPPQKSVNCKKTSLFPTRNQ